MALTESLRAFGTTVSDLELDFIHSNKLQISLQILDAEAALELSGSERILALWQRVWLAEGSRPCVELPLQCSQDACHEPMALEYSYEELRTAVHEARATSTMAPLTTRESLDILTEGLESWWGKHPRATTMMDFDEQLQAVDPLVNFVGATICPACGHEQSFITDLESLALRRLQAVQQRLILTIHRLAEAYGWSEEQILKLPAWRREIYCNLLTRRSPWS